MMLGCRVCEREILDADASAPVAKAAPTNVRRVMLLAMPRMVKLAMPKNNS